MPDNNVPDPLVRLPEDDTVGMIVPDPQAAITLDPNDQFEQLLIEMVRTNRAKRGDYASEINIFKNFYYVSNAMQLEGLTALEWCNSMVMSKTGRINNLRGRKPNNESVDDSYKDRAVYAVLSWGLYRTEGV